MVDTSALHAALDADDDHHSLARTALHNLNGAGETLASHNYVVLETIALAQRRLRQEASRTLVDDVLPALTIFWVERDVQDEACSRLLSKGRRAMSLVDCVSFTLMKRHGIEVALAFDEHFRDQGFQTVP